MGEGRAPGFRTVAAVNLASPIRRIFDLSLPVDATLPVFPGDPVPGVRPAATLERDGFNLLHVSMGSQTGTHVDAPYHVRADGARVDELDLSLLVAPATIVDLRGRPPRSPIRWADLAPYAGALAPGRMLVLHTDWSGRNHSRSLLDHPFLDVEAARRVVAAGVRTVGTDAMNIDESLPHAVAPPPLPAHHVVLGAGGVIAENLANLDAVDFPDPLVSLLPIRLTGADGAPVRAVAMQLAP